MGPCMALVGTLRIATSPVPSPIQRFDSGAIGRIQIFVDSEERQEVCSTVEKNNMDNFKEIQTR